MIEKITVLHQIFLFILGLIAFGIALRLTYKNEDAKHGLYFYALSIFVIFFSVVYPRLIVKIGEATYSLNDLKKSEPTPSSYVDFKALPLKEGQGQSQEAFLSLASEAWRSNKYDEALNYAFAGLRLPPLNSRVKAGLLTQVGTIFWDLKKADLALKYYEEAISVDPDLPVAHYALGNLYLAQGKYPEAEKKYKIAIHLSPDDPYVIFNYGTLDLVRKRYDDAESKFNKTIKLFPKFAEAYSNLGVLYDEQGKDDKAEDNLVRAVKINPNLPKSHLSLGNFYAKRNRVNEAENEYLIALRLEPEFTAARENLKLLLKIKEK